MGPQTSESYKRPEIQPPVVPIDFQPSLWLYGLLFGFAVFLVLLAFLDDIDWSGLALNLATEIIGAIIILIIVDRRIRSDELGRIQEYTGGGSPFKPKYWLFPYSAILYATALIKQIGTIGFRYYVSRPEYEELLTQYPQGFVLTGQAGIGKTTLVQRIAIHTASEFIKKPRRCRIPVFVPMRNWTKSLPLSEHIYQTLCKYHSTENWLFGRWLKKGKLLIILDGFDECPDMNLAVEELEKFRGVYGKNSVIVTGRFDINIQGLNKVALQGFSQSEASDFIRKAGLSDDVLSSLKASGLDVTSNPLLLTVAAHLAKRRGIVLPETRGELYEIAIQQILENIPEHSGVTAGQVISCLTKIAGVMSHENLTEICRGSLSSECLPVVEMAASHLGLLLATSEGCYRFSHIVLQEYFAAKNISKTNPSDASV